MTSAVIEKFRLGSLDKRLPGAVGLEQDNKEECSGLEGGAARRAGLRAVVTKVLAGGLAAYLCVRERETLRLRSELPR